MKKPLKLMHVQRCQTSRKRKNGDQLHPGEPRAKRQCSQLARQQATSQALVELLAEGQSLQTAW